MGQQQILLIVLSVILVGIAIAVGITMFRAQARNSNLDGIISDLNNLGSIAYQYKIRPVSMGGGGGEYEANEDTGAMGFSAYFDDLPDDMKATDNLAVDDTHGEYVVVSVDNDEGVVIRGYNVTYTHGRKITIDPEGRMTIGSWDPDPATD